MRSKRLRKRGDSLIRTPEERRRSRQTWGKAAYLAALAGIVFVLLRWGYDRLAYIEGTGFLEAEASFVEARSPGRIADINCNINDMVSAGDALVVLGQVRPGARIQGSHIRDGDRQFGSERRVVDLENKITLLKEQIAYGGTRVQRRRAELAKTRELLRLGAATESQVLRAADNLKEAEYDLTILEIKLENQTRLLEMYRQTYLLTSTEGQPEVALPAGYEGLLYAPEDGIVANIYKHKGEVVRTGEPVLKIIHPAKSFIKTYFRGTFERSLAVGDEARIVFENGEESDGVIQKIYRTAFSQPPEFKNRFGSVQRYIIAEVVPKDPVYWDRILETRAKVLVRKRWFFWQKSKPTQELQQARKKS